MESTTITLLPGHAAFGVSGCTHSQGTIEICLRCTACVFCQKELGQDDHSTFPVDKETEIFCHIDCLACPKGLGNCREYSTIAHEDDGAWTVTPYCDHDDPSCATCGIFGKSGGTLTAILCGSTKFYYHVYCAPVSKCQVCKHDITLSTMMKTENIYHHISLACTPGVCCLCLQPVLSDPYPIGLSSVINGVSKTVVHTACVTSSKCYRCGTSGGEFTVDRNWGRHELVHRGDCYPDICPGCSIVIGTTPSFRIENTDNRYHTTCLDSFACYICGEDQLIGLTKDPAGLTKDSTGLRHTGCDPTPCAHCHGPLGASLKRIINGTLYHGRCGPKCSACFSIKDSDAQSLTKLSDGTYLHDNCSREICFVCSKVLGPRSKWLKEHNVNTGTGVHLTCAFKCRPCGKIVPLVTNIPPDPEIHPRNLTFLPVQRRLEAAACRRVLKLKGAPKDIRRVILKLLANAPHDRTLLPIVKNGQHDLRNYCTPTRCKSARCPRCSNPICWTDKRHDHCVAGSCIYIKRALRAIASQVFGFRFALGEIAGIGESDYHWPLNEKEGLRKVTTLMIDNVTTRTEKQIAIYNALMTSLKHLLLQPVENPTDKETPSNI